MKTLARFLLGLALTTHVPAASAATLQYSWNACDAGIVNDQWLGPGRYHQALCVSGLAADVRSVHVVIGLGPYIPDAWAFGGCQPATGLSDSPNVPGAGSASVPVAVQAIMFPNLTNPQGTLFVEASYDPASPPNPAFVTGVGFLEFDLSTATVGPTTPGHCGGADNPFCFGVKEAWAVHANGAREDLAIAQDHLRWNDAPNAMGCPGSVPASRATWGGVKALYR